MVKDMKLIVGSILLIMCPIMLVLSIEGVIERTALIVWGIPIGAFVAAILLGSSMKDQAWYNKLSSKE